MLNKNIIERAKIVSDLLEQNYQSGRHDRCKLWVYRNIIYKKIPISQRTFFYYLKIHKQMENNK
ncbi:MAG: hypothetical protein LBS50_05260 [Prevotellaceae bacterium]|jgi:hypothetical protein|nr:hypothetical protein [Prevotellaceae bacterium]